MNHHVLHQVLELEAHINLYYRAVINFLYTFPYSFFTPFYHFVYHLFAFPEFLIFMDIAQAFPRIPIFSPFSLHRLAFLQFQLQLACVAC